RTHHQMILDRQASGAVNYLVGTSKIGRSTIAIIFARIKSGDTVIIERTEVDLRNPGGGAWSGKIILPDGVYLTCGEIYILEVADGRSVLITVIGLHLDSDAPTVAFFKTIQLA